MSLIYLIAGEASGDMLGAGLMRALKAECPELRFAGIGGEGMQREGLTSLFPYSALSVMGFWEVVPHIPKFLQFLRQAVQDIIAKKPDVIVTIDSPGFNFRLTAMLKQHPVTASIKRIHYVAPSVWAYKPGRARKTAQLFDMLLALLPFEPPYFEREGLKTIFVGHPVLWEPYKGDGDAFRVRHGIAQDEKMLLLLPGSRPGEVKRHLPIFLAAAEAMKGFRTVILAASQVKSLIREIVPPEYNVCGIEEKKDAFAAATLALSKSGTVTLELAVAGVPMVVAHTVSPLSAWLIRRMIRVKYASLVNIAVNTEVVPEQMQERCNVVEISKALTVLSTPAAMKQQQEACVHAISTLRGNNKENPNLIAAKAVLDILGTQAKP